jgi:glycosyltransferase involved in cell wall biosynthesis
MNMKTVSIVVPVYYNELNLPETIPTLLALSSGLAGYRLELVFVDDGSGDRSLEILLDWQKRHPSSIKVVKLSRNFGSMAAILAGMGASSGDCVGMISADLQDPPELLPTMIDHWSKGSKAVIAIRTGRHEPFLKRLFANSYYALVRKFALPNYPPGGFDFFVIDRQLVEDIKRIREKNTNLMNVLFWLGYNPVLIPYVRQERRAGKSRWTFSKRIKLFIDSFVAFSYAPIRFLSIAGIGVALTSFIWGGFVFYSWAVHKIPVKGYTPIAIVLASTAGLQMLMLGVLGEYVWRTLDETRRRPSFVIDEVFDTTSDPKPDSTPNARWQNVNSDAMTAYGGANHDCA